MRSWLCVVIFVSATCQVARTGKSDEAKAIIERAVQAHGGEVQVAKLKAAHLTAEGTVNLGVKAPLTLKIAWQSPNQYKMSATIEAAGNKVTLIQAYDGSAGWGSANDKTASVEGDKLSELKSQMHLRRVLMLTPLITNPRYKLSTLPDATVKEKASAVVKVTADGERDVTLYFDKSTGLLSQIERLVLDNDMKLVPQIDVLRDYKVVDGIQFAMTEEWHRAGTKVAEIKYTEVSFPEQIESHEFTRPAAGLPANFPGRRTANVIYGRKIGVALTMDVFTPQAQANGAAIIFVVSGGWVSDSEALNSQLIGHFIGEPIRRGYTVFAVFHGSQPKFTIPEVISDIHRAVRYIHHHARDYQIDPDRIGITGGSAGGHLSLMQGTAGDLGNPNATDAVERESSRVQAVACLFPPTDFLNYGAEGKYAFALDGTLAAFRTAVDVRELDPKTFRLERSTDHEKHLELAAKISPITHVSAEDPPTLIIHGDADKLVPIQQAQVIIEKLKAAGVPAELITRKGRGHDFAGIDKDVAAMMDWFDKHLKEPEKKRTKIKNSSN